MRKVLWRGFLAVICIGILYIALNTKPEEDIVARQFIQALISNDNDEAYELMTPTLQQSYRTKSSISSSILNNSSGVKRVVWHSRNVSNDQHTGVIHFSDSSKNHFWLTVTRQSDNSEAVSSVVIQ